MGNRTHRLARFVTRNAGNGGKKAFQFLRNTGRSLRSGISAGLDDIEDIELFDPPKPQATRKKS